MKLLIVCCCCRKDICRRNLRQVWQLLLSWHFDVIHSHIRNAVCGTEHCFHVHGSQLGFNLKVVGSGNDAIRSELRNVLLFVHPHLSIRHAHDLESSSNFFTCFDLDEYSALTLQWHAFPHTSHHSAIAREALLHNLLVENSGIVRTPIIHSCQMTGMEAFSSLLKFSTSAEILHQRTARNSVFLFHKTCFLFLFFVVPFYWQQSSRKKRMVEFSPCLFTWWEESVCRPRKWSIVFVSCWVLMIFPGLLWKKKNAWIPSVESVQFHSR